MPFVSFLLTRRDGLQRAMRLAAVLTFTGCAIRIIPCAMPLSMRRGHWWARLPLHIGQILNGIAGPVLIAAPSRLSAVWFPPVRCLNWFLGLLFNAYVLYLIWVEALQSSVVLPEVVFYDSY